MIIELEDAADPRVSDYHSLTDVQLRKVKEPAEQDEEGFKRVHCCGGVLFKD